ncbi:MAG: imelysin family protein [Roseobacter sp.]
MRLAFVLCFVAAPAVADVSAALNAHVLPGHSVLAAQTQKLSDAAIKTCAPDALRSDFNAAYDAWIAVSHLQLGPIEDEDLSLAISFWPDTKDRIGKALARLIHAQDPIVDDPMAFQEVSAAAQGFTALERLLYDPDPADAYDCRLTRAIATDLARKANVLQSGWPEFAALMTTAGADENTRFQTSEEAQQALYTSLSTGLEFLHDQRLGRPLGTFDRPRPRRAEAYRSERTLRHIQISLGALEELALLLSDDALSETRAAFKATRERAAAIDDPQLAGVAQPASRFRIEALQQSVRDIQSAVVTEIGTPLGISAGFNALDGD